MYARPSSADEEVLAHYAAVTHQVGARWVVASYAGGLLNCNVARDLPFVDAPLLVLWGERAHANSPVTNAPEYARLAKRGELHVFAHSGALPHEGSSTSWSRGRSSASSTPTRRRRSCRRSPRMGASRPTRRRRRLPLRPTGERPPPGGPSALLRKRPVMTTSIADRIFKSYDVRGIYPSELSDDLVERIARAFVREFELRSVAVGRDMRPSGETLFTAFARGATQAGADVTDIGLVSTDALYFAVGKYGFGGGVMITASHNPAGYNGLKLTRDQAQAISLETGLAAIRDRALKDGEPPAGVKTGAVTQRDIMEDFAAHCLSFIDTAAVKPFKIAIDAGNGMAGKTIPYVFSKLPCEVVPLYFELDGTFPNHPASPIEPENMVDLQRAVREHKCDLGVAFDGDADRMFLVDENGDLVGGDMVTALVGINTLKRYPGSRILYNLICSRSDPRGDHPRRRRSACARRSATRSSRKSCATKTSYLAASIPDTSTFVTTGSPIRA